MRGGVIMNLLDKLKQMDVIPQDATRVTIVGREVGGDRITYWVAGKPYDLAFDVGCFEAKESDIES